MEVVGALLAARVDVEAKNNVSMARACALSSHSRAEYVSMPSGECISLPLLLSLKTALRLRGLSSIADARLSQSGTYWMRDMLHDTSPQ
jgi:hypothetical protein